MLSFQEMISRNGFEVREYQQKAYDAVLHEWDNGNRRTLLVLPTGTGKTIVFAMLVRHMVREGKRVLILAHRGELLDQAVDKIARSTGLGCSVEKAESTCLDCHERVTVGSVQSLMRESRLKNFRHDYFDVIIVDEAHHVLANSYQRILEHFAGALVLGVTATPDRGDMQELGKYFDSLAYQYSLPRAIKDKYLAPIKALTIPIKLDLTKVAMRAGDFSAEGVAHAIDPYLEQIADAIVENARDRKGVVFLPLIATSQKFCELLRDRGIDAREVNGNSPDRAELLAGFDAGAFPWLCNSMLLTEGWDCPTVDCIVCLRPTKIRSLYAQIIGRGTRISPGKENLLLLDFLWLSNRHELARPAHLISESKDVADQMTAVISAAGGPVDLEEAHDTALADCVELRETALAKELARHRNKNKRLVDPLEYEMSVLDQDLSTYVPAFGWETNKPSDEQVKALEMFGVNGIAVESAGKANMLITRLRTRAESGLATPKQIKFLEARGFKKVAEWDHTAARKLIDRIAANAWRVPRGIVPERYEP